MQAMTPLELTFAITRSVQQAQNNRELDKLAGEGDSSDWFAELIDVLERGREQAIEMRDHAHEWVVDEEADRAMCGICGADGNA